MGLSPAKLQIGSVGDRGRCCLYKRQWPLSVRSRPIYLVAGKQPGTLQVVARAAIFLFTLFRALRMRWLRFARWSTIFLALLSVR